MKISAEKLAQIEAGADPKDVLTTEELAMYQEQLAAGSEEETQETTADDDQGLPGDEPEAQEPSASDVVAEVKSLNKEIGRLEAKLEAAEAAAEELKQKLAAKDADVIALMDVSKVAVDKLCVALGKPSETITSPTAMVARYQELTAEMGKKFKTGRQTTTPTEDPEGPKAAGNFRHSM